jgi:hypothetical protein
MDEYALAWSQPDALTSMVNWYRPAFRSALHRPWNPGRIAARRLTISQPARTLTAIDGLLRLIIDFAKEEPCMTAITSLSELQAIKARLGKLVFLDFSTFNLVDAHRELGAHVRDQVHKLLRCKLNGLLEDQLRSLLQQTRVCHATLLDRSRSTKVSPVIRSAIWQYLACLEAWTNGADLAGFHHPHLEQWVSSLGPLSAHDLALLLQHDNAGCQTGLYRQKDGSVILWHTEEAFSSEPGGEFDQLRVAFFQAGNGSSCIKMAAFIYPELLPGPAFGWRSDGFAQAVDALFLRPFPRLQEGILANVASWITLWLGPAVDTQEIIEALGPFHDGYALNSVCTMDRQVRAKKVEFAGNLIFPIPLGETPGEFLFQVNVFSQRHRLDLLKLESVSLESRKAFEQRLRRTQRVLKCREPRQSSSEEARFFLELLASRVGGEWAYANADTKAYFVNRVSPEGMEIWFGPGSALRHEQPEVIRVQIPSPG